MNDEAIETRAIEIERHHEIDRPPAVVPAPNPERARAALWGSDDPAEIVKRATKAADALRPVLEQRGMTTTIGDRVHVNVEGWQTLGSLVGIMVAQPWTRECPWPADERLTDELRAIRDAGYAFGYDAGYAAVTLGGLVVGGGEGTCRRTEQNWGIRGGEVVDDFALKGMAQTRAQSRTYASPLRFVVELAGYSGTPTDEMTQAQRTAAGGRGKGGGQAATPGQLKYLFDGYGPNRPALLASLNDDARAIVVRHVSGSETLTKGAAGKLIERLKDLDAQGREAALLAIIAEAGGMSDVPADVPEQTATEPAGDTLEAHEPGSGA